MECWNYFACTANPFSWSTKSRSVIKWISTSMHRPTAYVHLKDKIHSKTVMTIIWKFTNIIKQLAIYSDTLDMMKNSCIIIYVVEATLPAILNKCVNIAIALWAFHFLNIILFPINHIYAWTPICTLWITTDNLQIESFSSKKYEVNITYTSYNKE